MNDSRLMADGIGIAGGGPQRRFRGLIRRVSPRRAEAAGDDPG